MLNNSLIFLCLFQGERGEQGEVGPVGARGGPVSTLPFSSHSVRYKIITSIIFSFSLFVLQGERGKKGPDGPAGLPGVRVSCKKPSRLQSCYIIMYR